VTDRLWTNPATGSIRFDPPPAGETGWTEWVPVGGCPLGDDCDLTPEAMDALGETYDTQMEVERNPCGAWQAIQSQAEAIVTLRARLAKVEARLATALELIALLEEDQARRDAQPTPEAVARAALEGFPNRDDWEWIDNRADELFRDSERRRGGVRPATITPQDYRDYFVVNATAKRIAAIIAKAEGGE
jgi:hypothetical protein